MVSGDRLKVCYISKLESCWSALDEPGDGVEDWLTEVCTHQSQAVLSAGHNHNLIYGLICSLLGQGRNRQSFGAVPQWG